MQRLLKRFECLFTCRTHSWLGDPLEGLDHVAVPGKVAAVVKVSHELKWNVKGHLIKEHKNRNVWARFTAAGRDPKSPVMSVSS